MSTMSFDVLCVSCRLEVEGVVGDTDTMEFLEAGLSSFRFCISYLWVVARLGVFRGLGPGCEGMRGVGNDIDRCDAIML